MKKIFFLLVNLLLASPILLADSCNSCATSCSSSKCSSSKSCDESCAIKFHGKSFRRMENTFQNGTPTLVSLFNTNVVKNLEDDNKKGGVEVTVFGGKNTHQASDASYYFPYGFKEFTFDGSVTNAGTFAKNIAWRSARFDFAVNDTGATDISVHDVTIVNSADIDGSFFSGDATTYQFDRNTDKSKILPWNFGITYAALFEPLGASAINQKAGTGLITSPTFKSTITPKHLYSHVGAGIALRYHFSDDEQGWFAQASTAVENVKSKICLQEQILTQKTALTNKNFPAQTNCIDATGGQLKSDNPYGLPLTSSGSPLPPALDNSNWPACDLFIYTTTGGGGTIFNTYEASETPKGSINEAYLNGTTGTYFPTDDSTVKNTSVAPENVSQAFRQEAWHYGKIGCDQSVTRLADIELILGYQWLCGPCASNSWYVGMIIPTGNKPCATYVAPAVVGNGQHFGLMFGSTLQMMLCEKEERACWYRLDVNCRYLFSNKQKRSLDVLDNEWSRYMMVWDSKDSYIAAVKDVAGKLTDGETPTVDTAGVANRHYTPGINIFTTDVKVTPGLQTRLNQALFVKSEHLQAELGWNTFIRSAECLKYACAWDKAPAFADSSFIGGVGLNNGRTIYNDSQTTSENAVPALYMKAIGGDTATLVYNLAQSAANATANQDLYDQYVITQDQLDLDSAATPEGYIHSPYAVLGYAFGCDHKSVISLGGSYEFSSNNSAMNQWNVWGKFEFAF